MYAHSFSSDTVVCSGIKTPFVFFVHDRPLSGGQKVLTDYLTDAQKVFHGECDALLSIEHVFTEGDAARLTNMLALLVDARKTWQEEEVESGRAA